MTFYLKKARCRLGFYPAINLEIEDIIPDTYVHNVYDINYLKLYENGIRCAVFDIDCTILPFDDVKVPKELVRLFDYIKDVGISPALCSSASYKRVAPVGEALTVKFISNARKPFYGDFKLIKNLFEDSDRENTMMVGDSFYLDMIFAQRLGLYKVMVDAIDGGNKIMTLANSIVQTTAYSLLPRDKFTYGKYYHGIKG